MIKKIVNKIQIRLYVKFLYGFCYWGNCFIFAITKYVSSCSIAWILNLTSFGSIFVYLESFSIINNPFDKYLFTKGYWKFNITVEFVFSMNPWQDTRFSNSSGIPIPSNKLIFVSLNVVFFEMLHNLFYWNNR